MNDPNFDREVNKKYAALLETKTKANEAKGLSGEQKESDDEVRIRRHRYCELIVGSLKASK